VPRISAVNSSPVENIRLEGADEGRVYGECWHGSDYVR